jgi:hypothetical protein
MSDRREAAGRVHRRRRPVENAGRRELFRVVAPADGGRNVVNVEAALPLPALRSLVAKDPGVLAAEMAAAKPGDPLPAPNTEARRSLSDLKPGTAVTIEAASDIRLQPTIQATRIILP